MEKPNDAGHAGDNGQGAAKPSFSAKSFWVSWSLLALLHFWLYARTYESTDDAQVDGH